MYRFAAAIMITILCGRIACPLIARTVLLNAKRTAAFNVRQRHTHP